MISYCIISIDGGIYVQRNCFSKLPGRYPKGCARINEYQTGRKGAGVREPRMNLVDSCVWLEYFADGADSDFFAPAVERKNRIIRDMTQIPEIGDSCAVLSI